MKKLVDVVNFNADASCLSSGRWLDILGGGKDSLLAAWLRLYADRGKKVTLGFPGATVADMATFNPEAIELINSRPDIFEIILRPFAHDIGLLRTGKGFELNYQYGCRTIRREFDNVSDYFLPPEFMLTNEQLVVLHEAGTAGVFINPARFSSEMRERIPTLPYRVRGLLGRYLNCIPFYGRLTFDYLEALHSFDSSAWNGSMSEAGTDLVFSWRDGESPFFIPEGVTRESCWLEGESGDIERVHLREAAIGYIPSGQLGEMTYKSYPVHSFSAWMKEFRMLGYIHRVQSIEEKLGNLPDDRIFLWLMVINSDILSAVEKKSPLVRMKESAESRQPFDFTIRRSERGVEGEEYLAILELVADGGSVPEIAGLSKEPHFVKWRCRFDYLKEHFGAAR